MEIRNVGSLRPHLANVGGAAARRREEIRRGDAAVPREHAPGGPPHREVDTGRLVRDPSVDLASAVGEEVEMLGRLQRRERIRARCDRLRLERREAPVVGHLSAYDTADVGV